MPREATAYAISLCHPPHQFVTAYSIISVADHSPLAFGDPLRSAFSIPVLRRPLVRAAVRSSEVPIALPLQPRSVAHPTGRGLHRFWAETETCRSVDARRAGSTFCVCLGGEADRRPFALLEDMGRRWKTSLFEAQTRFSTQ